MSTTIQDHGRIDLLSAVADGSNGVTRAAQPESLCEERGKVLQQAETDASKRPTPFRALLALSGTDALALAMLMKALIFEAAATLDSGSLLPEIAPYAGTMLRLQREGRRLLQVERFLAELDHPDGARLPRLTS